MAILLTGSSIKIYLQFSRREHEFKKDWSYFGLLESYTFVFRTSSIKWYGDNNKGTHPDARPQLGGRRWSVRGDDEHQAAGEPGGPHLLPHPQLGSQTAGCPRPGASNMKQAEQWGSVRRCVSHWCMPVYYSSPTIKTDREKRIPPFPVFKLKLPRIKKETNWTKRCIRFIFVHFKYHNCIVFMQAFEIV